MSNNVLFALALMAVSGVAIAVQAPLNAALGRSVGSAVAAAAVSFGIGFVLLLVLAVLIGDGAAFARLGTTPLWMMTGGALGALYVLSAIWSVPLLGVLTITTMLILGQMCAALLLDYFGAFGLPHRDISLTRVIAALMVAGGVILSRW